MRATAATTTGRSTSSPRGSFGGDIWCIKYRSIDNPNDPLTANYDNAPGRDLWKPGGATTASGCRDRRANSIENVDPDLKPMSQDSYQRRVRLRGQSAHRRDGPLRAQQPRSARSKTSAGLVNGDEVYVIGNPGEGLTRRPRWRRGHRRLATAVQPTPKPKRQYDAVELGISRRFSERLVRQRQPDDQPALRQLRGSRELGRNPHADDGRRRRRPRSSRRARRSARAAT